MTATSLEDLESMTAEVETDVNAVTENDEDSVEGNEDDLSERGLALRAARRAKADAIFKGKVWRIHKAVTAPEGQKFETPFGNKCVKGFAMKLEPGQVPAEGYKDRMVVGKAVVADAIENYGAECIVNADEFVKPQRARRNKAEKAAERAAYAAEQAALLDALFADAENDGAV